MLKHFKVEPTNTSLNGAVVASGNTRQEMKIDMMRETIKQHGVDVARGQIKDASDLAAFLIAIG